jgi:hypothetical protein
MDQQHWRPCTNKDFLRQFLCLATPPPPHSPPPLPCLQIDLLTYSWGGKISEGPDKQTGKECFGVCIVNKSMVLTHKKPFLHHNKLLLLRFIATVLFACHLLAGTHFMKNSSFLQWLLSARDLAVYST